MQFTVINLKEDKYIGDIFWYKNNKYRVVSIQDGSAICEIMQTPIKEIRLEKLEQLGLC